MIDSLRLYLRFALASARCQLEYRASVVMLAAGQFFVTCIDFAGIWALFDRFRSIRGWQLAEVGLLYGMINLSFAIAEATARGFDTFETLVRSGDFDRILLRPRSPALQVAGRELQLFRAGRFTQGAVIFGWACWSLEIAWSPAKVLLAAAAIVGGACVFAGLFVLQATLSFWSTSTLELLNTVTYGGVETAQYPLDVYRPWFRRFFTLVVPLACANYLPAQAILERPGTTPWVPWVAPLFGVLFLLASLRAWNYGVRHYRSTGS